MAGVFLLAVRVKEPIVMPSAEWSYYRYWPIVAGSL
jgi:hypothetical protein